MKGNPFEWMYCPTCDIMTIICPNCGNNCCNGGSGEVEGEECGVCSLAHEYQNTQRAPEKPEDWEQQKENAKNAFQKMFGSKK